MCRSGCQDNRSWRSPVLAHRERRFDNTAFRSFDLSWDGDDNLRSVSQQGTNWFNATYNGDGLRVTKTDFWTPWHHYTWGLGGVLVDSNDSQPMGAALNTLVYTPGVSQNVNGTDSFFHTDWLGSTRYLSDSTGNSFPAVQRYTAFGEVSSPLGLQPPSYYQFGADWGYQTEWSASYEPGLGLQYLEQRYYDPAVGRFVSPDPLGFAATPNLYGYVSNDPVNGADPFGLQGPEEYVEPAGGLQDLRQRATQFRASPEFRPGSKQRVEYSRFLDTLGPIGLAKQAWQVISGRDPVGGRTVSTKERVVSALAIGFAALCHLGGGEEGNAVQYRDPESVRFSRNSIKWAFRTRRRARSAIWSTGCGPARSSPRTSLLSASLSGRAT